MSEPTKRFLAFMPFIFEWEGGYDNDPDDPGGETNFGIDKRSHPSEDIKHLTIERAQEIYFSDYWQKCKADEMPPHVGEVLMNIAVNAGLGRASKWLQELVGTTVDGVIGPKTVAAAQAHSEGLAVKLLDRLEAHYRSIAHGSLSKYLRGWLNRNNSLRDWIASH